MVSDLIIAGLAVLVVALRPRSWASTCAAVSLAGLGVVLGGRPDPLGEAVRTVAPMAAFLLVAVGAAALAVRLGVARGAARRLGALARGDGHRLFVLVCLVTVLLTAVVSLDGAVVVMAPILVELHRKHGAPLRPLLLGVVTVANASSLALPEGNPTNLVVIERLGLPLGRAATTMVLPGVIATLLCAAAIGWSQRRALGTPFVRRETSAAASPLAPGLFGVLRVVLQIVALLVVVLPLAGRATVTGAGLPLMLGVAVGVSLLAALANNLPASAIVAAGLASGPAAYAALAGLSVGALATPQGSVATLIAGDLAGERPHARVLLPIALAAALAATVVFWLISIS